AFFFQAEDGIRYFHVTGVQTCALPICPGTPAARLEDDTPEAVKKERLQILQARIIEQARRISEGMVGTRQRILVSGLSRKDEFEIGRASCRERVKSSEVSRS